MHRVIPEISLYFRNNGTQSRKERSKDHFVSVPGVYGFARFSEDEVVPPDLVEFWEVLAYIYVFYWQVYVVLVKVILLGWS